MLRPDNLGVIIGTNNPLPVVILEPDSATFIIWLGVSTPKLDVMLDPDKEDIIIGVNEPLPVVILEPDKETFII